MSGQRGQVTAPSLLIGRRGRTRAGRPPAGPRAARGHAAPGAPGARAGAPAAAPAAAAARTQHRAPRAALRRHLGVPGRPPAAGLVRPGQVRHLHPLGGVLRAQFRERMVLVSAPPAVGSDSASPAPPGPPTPRPRPAATAQPTVAAGLLGPWRLRPPRFQRRSALPGVKCIRHRAGARGTIAFLFRGTAGVGGRFVQPRLLSLLLVARVKLELPHCNHRVTKAAEMIPVVWGSSEDPRGFGLNGCPSLFCHQVWLRHKLRVCETSVHLDMHWLFNVKMLTVCGSRN